MLLDEVCSLKLSRIDKHHFSLLHSKWRLGFTFPITIASKSCRYSAPFHQRCTCVYAMALRAYVYMHHRGPKWLPRENLTFQSFAWAIHAPSFFSSWLSLCAPAFNKKQQQALARSWQLYTVQWTVPQYWGTQKYDSYIAATFTHHSWAFSNLEPTAHPITYRS